jgi:hypothetical protein
VSFKTGFFKTAGVVTNALGAAAKGVGKAVTYVGGGKLNTALTALGAASDYSDISAKMRNAATR